MIPELQNYMKLSVITPTLNAVEFLERAIQSVLSQGFDSLEHWIIDGGSSDGTLEVVSRYSHLKLLSGPDEGIFDAMNKGVGIASGDWIYFLGADDYFADDHVLNDLKPIFDGDSDVVYGDIVSGRHGERYDGPFDTIKIGRKNVCHQAIFFRHRVFNLIGTFNKIYRSYADWDHNMRWMLNRNIKKEYVDRVIAVYADNGFSFINPDPLFHRDRLYRYLTYGRDEIPMYIFGAVLGKELGRGFRQLDWSRIKRAISVALGP